MPMKLDELLDSARSERVRRRFALAVIDLLGVAHPCGYEPIVADEGWVVVPDDVAGRLSPEEARGIAASILRAAELADDQEAAIQEAERERVARREAEHRAVCAREDVEDQERDA